MDNGDEENGDEDNGDEDNGDEVMGLPMVEDDSDQPTYHLYDWDGWELQPEYRDQFGLRPKTEWPCPYTQQYMLRPIDRNDYERIDWSCFQLKPEFQNEDFVTDYDHRGWWPCPVDEEAVFPSPGGSRKRCIRVTLQDGTFQYETEHYILRNLNRLPRKCYYDPVTGKDLAQDNSDSDSSDESDDVQDDESHDHQPSMAVASEPT